MKRLLLLAILSLGLASCSTTYRWRPIPADASRTGVTPTTADNVRKALGDSDGRVYNAPNGKVFEGGVTPQLAFLLIDAQSGMKELKQVIAYAPHAMLREHPESELTNFAVDVIMDACETITGKKSDIGLLNFGGIRCDVPMGDVLMDDIVSMFPFKNYLVRVEIPGSRVREIFEQMAGRGVVQVVGGVKLVIEDNKLVCLEIGGEPLDENRCYGLATIDFLLDGGDGFHLKKDAVEILQTDAMVINAILPRVMELGASGKPFEYHTDGRVVIR